MIERALITAVIGFAIIIAITSLNIGRLFEIDFDLRAECSDLQKETCG